MKFSHTAIKALVVILASCSFQVVTGQSRARLIRFPEWTVDNDDEPQLELVEILVAGKPVKLGESFLADDNWLKSMSLRIRNVGKKPIIAFGVGGGLLSGVEEELPPYASFQYGIAWNWGKGFDPEKSKPSGITLKPGEVVELTYGNVGALNRKVLATPGEGSFCKLKFLSPSVQYADGTTVFIPNMLFHGTP